MLCPGNLPLPFVRGAFHVRVQNQKLCPRLSMSRSYRLRSPREECHRRQQHSRQRRQKGEAKTRGRESRQGTERETSSARSVFDRSAGEIANISIGGRCEPRTSRAPAGRLA